MTSPHHQSDEDSPVTDHPGTALGEVIREFEEAETRDVGRSATPEERDGEAGDALTTNREAQEDASGG
jgi:hypothetical protein